MDSAITMLPDEIKLVARAKTEPAAFAIIYDHYFSRVYNYIHYRIGDPDASDDVTADTFEKLLANIDRFRPGRGSFATWVFTIARNAVNDHFRRQNHRHWISLDRLFNQDSKEPEPEEIISDEETHKDLLAALTHLCHRDQDLIALKFGAGLTSFQIAKITGLHQNNVNVSVYRAVQRLRNMLIESK